MRGACPLWGRPYGVKGICIALAYAAFSLGDMEFSRRAFTLGVGEVNPCMSWLAHHGLFVPGKLALTMLAATLIAWVYPRGRSTLVVWGAVLVMGAVNLYHLWGLSVL